MPLRARTKKAFLTGWETLATTDEAQILAWDAQYPDANAGSVAKGVLGGVWFFEVDSPDVVDRIKAETGKAIPDTFRVRSRPGRGHYYFKQTPQSIAMGNIAQNFVKNNDWSARVDREYVVSPGSIHPETQEPYLALRDEPIIEAPQWLLDWLLGQKQSKQSGSTVGVSVEGEKIPRGAHDTELTRIAGKLRQIGLEEEAIYQHITEVCEKRCIDYGTDYKEMTAKIAKSVCRYEPGKDERILFGGKEGGTSIIPQESKGKKEPLPVPTDEQLAKSESFTYPHFPSWIMDGTSIYTNFVKPVCDVNSRIPYFMWYPALQIMMNYLTLHVRVKDKDVKGNLYSVLVGRKGIIKSSSVDDAIRYMTAVGIADQSGMDTQNANGKALVWTAGSPEGFGMDMHKTNCKNGILYYDELSSLTKKAGIDGSNMIGALLTMYESGKFANAIKAKKDSYGLKPGTYAASLIACTTDETFQPLWSTLAGGTTGLNDRFVFLYQPEEIPDITEQIVVNTDMDAHKTKAVIDKAVQQVLYIIADTTPFRRLYRLGNRFGHRAEKYALYFAIDLGRDEIDEDCVERACALVDYEIAVKKYLKTYEAITREGALQQELIGHLENASSKLSLHKLKRKIHADRFGTTLWAQIYDGLKRTGAIRESGTGTKGDPKMVFLMANPDGVDDD